MGVKLEVWKQGQFYPELGKKIIELPYSVNPGPSDNQIKIEGFDVRPDHNGNFLDKDYSEDEVDAISTYGTLRQVIDLYEELLEYPIKWSWQKNKIEEPLKIRIRNNDINSRFLKDQKCIELDYYGPYENWTYNCRTVDLIAHELGHAILDSLLPHLNKGTPESRGIGEAFCDLAAMFLILNQKDMCDHLFQETHGDLRKNNILALFGVGHGYHGKLKELRNANNKIKYRPNEWSPYYYSHVLVGLLYDLLCEILKTGDHKRESDADKIYRIGQYWKHRIFMTFMSLRNNESNLQDFCALLLKQFEDETDKIKKRLNQRMFN
ncbi:MAG: hypothetical protein MI975_29255, partial [Cytophagales bacterium]|nr:hypothetical protein [Cytophagales bacterium]